MVKTYSFPEKYQEKIEKALASIGYSLNKPADLAKSVLELSSFYQEGARQTPWNSPAAQAAYLSYFFPLNYIRHLKVLDEQKEFLSSQSQMPFFDFGFGLGSSRLALLDTGILSHSTPYTAIEQSTLTRKHYEQLDSQSQIQWTQDIHLPLPEKCFGIFSYSLNELKTIPPWIFKLSSALILEPSTQHIGRQLMELRSRWVEQSFSILAPCSHQKSCPLLNHSKSDWCHDRIHWEQPQWFADIEKRLPIKNNTLTYSYLLVSKSPSLITSQGRIVSDELKEKGKTRWLFCRSEEREYLSWLDRNGKTPDFKRGDQPIVEVTEKRGNELRFKLS